LSGMSGRRKASALRGHDPIASRYAGHDHHRRAKGVVSPDASRAPAAILPMSHNVIAGVAKSVQRAGPIHSPRRRCAPVNRRSCAGIPSSKQGTRERIPWHPPHPTFRPSSASSSR
jgi:hypothetical protein